VSFYKSSKWKRKRAVILRRDEYMCRECKRYGRTTPATTVHHVYPLEQYPELALVSANLVGMCAACHDAMHDRDARELTARGNEWKDRVPPPSVK
jgi:5-methylcytosine-specific restriction protein A